METLLRGQPVQEFVEPPGMVRMEVCADSGMIPASSKTGLEHGVSRWPVRCPYTISELFIEGTQPTRVDDWHWMYALDVRNGLLAGPGCPSEFVTYKYYTLYPAEAQEWVRWQNIPQPPTACSPLCPGHDVNCEAPPPSPPLALASPAALLLVSPDHGSRYQLSPELPPWAQRLLVAARPADGMVLEEVALLVDGRPLATLSLPPYQAIWPMEPGLHTFTAVGVDRAGHKVQGNQNVIEVVDQR